MEMPHIGSLKSTEGIWDGIADVNHHVVRRRCSFGTMDENQLIRKPPCAAMNQWIDQGVLKTVEFTMTDDAASYTRGVSYNKTPSLK